MEILKKGIKQSSEWIGECDNCGCIVKYNDELITDVAIHYIECPNCQKVINFYNLGSKRGQFILDKIE